MGGHKERLSSAASKGGYKVRPQRAAPTAVISWVNETGKLKNIGDYPFIYSRSNRTMIGSVC